MGQQHDLRAPGSSTCSHSASKNRRGCTGMPWRLRVRTWSVVEGVVRAAARSAWRRWHRRARPATLRCTCERWRRLNSDTGVGGQHGRVHAPRSWRNARCRPRRAALARQLANTGGHRGGPSRASVNASATDSGPSKGGHWSRTATPPIAAVVAADVTSITGRPACDAAVIVEARQHERPEAVARPRSCPSTPGRWKPSAYGCSSTKRLQRGSDGCNSISAAAGGGGLAESAIRPCRHAEPVGSRCGRAWAVRRVAGRRSSRANVADSCVRQSVRRYGRAEVAPDDLARRRRQIGRRDAASALPPWRGSAAPAGPRVEVGEMRKVDAGTRTETVPAPDARIDVEQLQAPSRGSRMNSTSTSPSKPRLVQEAACDSSSTSGATIVSTNVLARPKSAGYWRVRRAVRRWPAGARRHRARRTRAVRPHGAGSAPGSSGARVDQRGRLCEPVAAAAHGSSTRHALAAVSAVELPP